MGRDKGNFPEGESGRVPLLMQGCLVVEQKLTSQAGYFSDGRNASSCWRLQELALFSAAYHRTLPQATPADVRMSRMSITRIQRQ
jgi:hypothetical protein